MFKKLLIESALLLKTAGIPYIVVGGQAVLLYGEPRFTRDIDITLGLDTDQRFRVMEAFKMSGFTPRPKDVDKFILETSVLPMEHLESGIRLDLIFSFSPFERTAIDRAHFIELDGVPIAFASVEDLIILKIFAGRSRDMEDVKTIVIKNPALDVKYVDEWLRSFEPVVERPLVQLWKEIIADR